MLELLLLLQSRLLLLLLGSHVQNCFNRLLLMRLVKRLSCMLRLLLN
jgi:hypothetical protein